MSNSSGGLVEFLIGLPIFEAEWVLWLLLILWFVSVAVMLERYVFFSKRRIDASRVRSELDELLAADDFKGAAKHLEKYDSLETNVVLFGLRQYSKGPESVEDLLTGAESSEKQRFQSRLGFLATVGSNAPFIGLFGTVLGIIKAFGELGEDLSAAGGDLMLGISEALVATGVGLVVAIPAVIAFNYFNAKLTERVAKTDLLARTLLAQLKSEEEAA